MVALASTALERFLDRAVVERESVRRRGLRRFVELAWSQIESARFIPGWHLDEICAHLEAVSRGEIRRLVINVPPGCTKSLTVSVLWPAWDWITRPGRKWMFASFDDVLSLRDARRCRELMDSEWYRARWETRVVDSQDKQNTATVFHTSGGGFRFSTSVGGKATGWHSHIQVVDDPIKPKDVYAGAAQARTALEASWNWWGSTMASRKADPQDFARVIIMQRLHEDDLAGRCLRDGGYVHLNLPMRFEPERRCVTPIGGDRRTEDGELLWPARYDEATVAETTREMGTMVASAQLQQRPAPASGAIFKRDWLIKEWRELPANATFVQSWDCAFKGLSTSDYVVGQLWAHYGAQSFLVDQVKAKMDFPETLATMRAVSHKPLWKRARAKYVEDKANGSAIIDTLKNELDGIIAVTPEGGKEARANAVAPYFEAGNVLVPTPESAPWIHDWRESMATFPMGRHDDDVDATTQALLKLHGDPQHKYRSALMAYTQGAR